MEMIVFGSFLVLSLVAFVCQRAAKATDQQKKSVSNANFIKFQRSFFLVYFLALFGDWLQGPYVYKLYNFYGYKEDQIATLYVAGFASSVLIGTATGPLADKLGRRRITQLFTVMYSFCCMTKFSGNFSMLMIGRVLGGISTSMLFSCFESWYVYEHCEHFGFPNEWISVTFSQTTFWNGLLAILAGVMSNFAAETLGYGPIAPFAIAVIPLIFCGLIVTYSWPENFGNRKLQFGASCGQGLRQILKDRKVFMLGLMQTIVESVMYIFVFLWTPVLMPAAPPLGMVFATFMVAIMIGSTCYTLILSKGYRPEDTLKLVLAILSVTMTTCCVFAGPQRSLTDMTILYVAFLALEVAIGMYFPAMSYLKSQIIPESHRANVMNWFRVPMNVITCAVLLSLHMEILAHDKRLVFAFCTFLCVLGLVINNRNEIRINQEPYQEVEKSSLLKPNDDSDSNNV